MASTALLRRLPRRAAPTVELPSVDAPPRRPGAVPADPAPRGRETVEMSTFGALRGSAVVAALAVLFVIAAVMLAGGVLPFDGWPAGGSPPIVEHPGGPGADPHRFAVGSLPAPGALVRRMGEAMERRLADPPRHQRSRRHAAKASGTPRSAGGVDRAGPRPAPAASDRPRPRAIGSPGPRGALPTSSPRSPAPPPGPPSTPLDQPAAPLLPEPAPRDAGPGPDLPAPAGEAIGHLERMHPGPPLGPPGA